MLTKVNRHSVELYDSIDELPITRFQQYNRFLLIDSGIGGDIESVDKHYATIWRYIDKGDIDKAKQELANARQNLHFIIQNTTPRMNAFVALIHRLNGKEITNLSDEDVKNILIQLSKAGWTVGSVFSLLSEIKKKLTAKWRFFFRLFRICRA